MVNFSNNKKYFIISILLVVLVIPSFVSAVWWNPFSWNIWQKIAEIFYKPQVVQIEQEKKVDEKIEDKKSEQDFNDETANWKTYTNTEYGFEFKYPNKYFFRIAEPSTTLFFLMEQVGDKQVNLFEIYLKKLHAPLLQDLTGICDADGPNASITCNKINKYEKIGNIHKFYLNQVITYSNWEKEEQTIGPWFVVEIPNSDNVIFVFEVGMRSGLKTEHAEEYLEKILSTFKFIK